MHTPDKVSIQFNLVNRKILYTTVGKLRLLRNLDVQFVQKKCLNGWNGLYNLHSFRATFNSNCNIKVTRIEMHITIALAPSALAFNIACECHFALANVVLVTKCRCGKFSFARKYSVVNNFEYASVWFF